MKPNADVAMGLAGLLEWSEPIIFDRLLEAYRARLGAGATSWSLARLHARAWRAAISGDMARFETARWDLADALVQSSLHDSDAADADAEIMIELLDIVMARYQRSTSVARSYHLALIALAGRLSPTPALSA
ncbi:MAG TPA: hypothetical protein VKS78_00240 [Roseiarcus sp.]|nr:hypothetical protein [Roseiarcus sp.]